MYFFDKISINNFRNIKALTIDLGLINIFIGIGLCVDDSLYHAFMSQTIEALGRFSGTIIEPTKEEIKIASDIVKGVFYPIVEDIKLDSLRWPRENRWSYKNPYQGEWYYDTTVSSLMDSLLTLLNNEDLGLPYIERKFACELNPRSSRKLLTEMIKIAERKNRQLVLFTDQPDVLDALDLNNDSHRLFTADFNRDFSRKITRIKAPKPLKGQEAVPLSEAWLRGYIGGLSKGF